ncbi:MAG: NADH-quinone oxidoreductase subunit J [Muribaculaceae bacterium]|jgi:NADH-quinone oxidoreductase subunit J|nr:NADH-quinone oxidoreductase subunit J [Muribaculaceae bacterium]
MESVGSIIVYAVIALTIIVCSVLAVTTRKILRAATYLLFSLFATAALYFQLDYEFLGAVQIAVYAGGIVVLFVFSILLTSKPGDNTPALASKKRVLGGIGALAMFLVAGYSLVSRTSMLSAVAAGGNPSMTEIGTALMGTGHGQYLLPFEAISVLLLACIIGGVVIARKH